MIMEMIISNSGLWEDVRVKYYTVKLPFHQAPTSTRHSDYR